MPKVSQQPAMRNSVHANLHQKSATGATKRTAEEPASPFLDEQLPPINMSTVRSQPATHTFSEPVTATPPPVVQHKLSTASLRRISSAANLRDSPPPSLRNSSLPSPASSEYIEEEPNLSTTTLAARSTTELTTPHFTEELRPKPTDSPGPASGNSSIASTDDRPLNKSWFAWKPAQQAASTTPHYQSPLSQQVTEADVATSDAQTEVDVDPVAPLASELSKAASISESETPPRRASWWQWSSQEASHEPALVANGADPVPPSQVPPPATQSFWGWFGTQPNPATEKDAETDTPEPPKKTKSTTSLPQSSLQHDKSQQMSMPNGDRPDLDSFPTNGDLHRNKRSASVSSMDQHPEDTTSKQQRKSNTFWAFWSQKESGTETATEHCEFAMSGTPSETHPVKTDIATKKDAEAEKKAKPTGKAETKTPTTPVKKATPTASPAAVPKPPTPTKPPTAPKVVRPNLVLPPIEDNFPVYSSTRMIKNSWKRLSSWWTKNDTMTKVPWSDPINQPSTAHLYRRSPQAVRKVVVIGVHGFFPMKMLRSIIGEPTGTSMKFADEAAKAFEEWGKTNGVEDIVVEKIALEGEGKVFSRVDGLYKLLMNWMDHIQEADCILFAAHSQGTPVAAHLLARLVAEGHMENKKLGLIGMAGISLGPFAGMDQNLMVRAYSSIESSSLKELFQFQDLSSVHSRKYIESLRTIIAHNAKIVFVGSINDQLVPLYSSTCVHVSHPNILRAVYIDGSTEFSPVFLSGLVSLALRLRNLGGSDHNLVKELSGSLAGSLRGGGHSRIYHEPRVYELAIRHLLETTDPDPTLPLVVDHTFTVPPKQYHNPYLLPWSLHGLCTEASVRPKLRPLLTRLVRDFREWNPESKVLKEVKYRLSAVEAQL